jgi:hypothetical protein
MTLVKITSADPYDLYGHVATAADLLPPVTHASGSNSSLTSPSVPTSPVAAQAVPVNLVESQT